MRTTIVYTIEHGTHALQAINMTNEASPANSRQILALMAGVKNPRFIRKYVAYFVYGPNKVEAWFSLMLQHLREARPGEMPRIFKKPRRLPEMPMISRRETS